MTAREAAYLALEAYRKRGARPGIVLDGAAGGMDRRDTALASNITDGVLQNMALCDHYIAAHTVLKRLQPEVLTILRLSVYQIYFLTRVPPRAAVSEGVELAKAHAPKAAGLVNAVLRRASECRSSPPEITAEGDERLAVLYSHPLWLVRELTAEYGAADCEKILASDNSPAPLTFQVNTLRSTEEEAEKSLLASGAAAARHPFLVGALTVADAGPAEKLDAFLGGLVYVQDAAARMAVTAAALRPGDFVIDVCAAPGGKSFAAAIDMENTGRILSCDLHGSKLGLIGRGAWRLGITIIETLARDAREPAPELEGKADVVLADVPCSGFGVMRGKPEIRYKPQESVERLPELQLDILRSSSRMVRPGGTLLYSTCTLLRRENEGVIGAFLAGNGDFATEPFELPAPFGACGGMRTILPFEGGTDGFFICRMKRKK